MRPLGGKRPNPFVGLWERGLAGSGLEVGGWVEESSRTTEGMGLSPGSRGVIPLTEALGAQALDQDARPQGPGHTPALPDMSPRTRAVLMSPLLLPLEMETPAESERGVTCPRSHTPQTSACKSPSLRHGVEWREHRPLEAMILRKQCWQLLRPLVL